LPQNRELFVKFVMSGAFTSASACRRVPVAGSDIDHLRAVHAALPAARPGVSRPSSVAATGSARMGCPRLVCPHHLEPSAIFRAELGVVYHHGSLRCSFQATKPGCGPHRPCSSAWSATKRLPPNCAVRLGLNGSEPYHSPPGDLSSHLRPHHTRVENRPQKCIAWFVRENRVTAFATYQPFGPYGSMTAMSLILSRECRFCRRTLRGSRRSDGG